MIFQGEGGLVPHSPHPLDPRMKVIWQSVYTIHEFSDLSKFSEKLYLNIVYSIPQCFTLLLFQSDILNNYIV